MRIPSKEEYNVGLQRYRKLYAKIVLTNSKGQDLGAWESFVIGDPSFTIDANSAIRRTCSLTISAHNTKGLESAVGFGKNIWIDTYVQIYLGIEDMRSKEVVYTNMGKYMISNPSRVYSATENTFTIKGIDLMCKLTGLRNGNFEGGNHIIKQGANVRQVFIKYLEMAGFKRYVIDECQFSVPNQININADGTIYDIFQELLNIDPTMQIYFDEDGVFHYEKIPTGDNEQVIVDTDYWDKVLLSYNIEYDFDSIKNVVHVLGKTHDIKYYGEATISTDTYGNNIYSVNISVIENYTDNLKIGFIAPSVNDNPNLVQINNLQPLQVLDEHGNYAKFNTHFTEEGSGGANSYQVVRYIAEVSEGGVITTPEHFLYLGEITPYGYAEDNDPDSPFNMLDDNKLGRIPITLQGGEYDKITTVAQAQKRAEWELYKSCRLNDNIEITCVPTTWLDVNCLIEIKLPNKNGVDMGKKKYIIKNISTTFGVNGQQVIKASRYYPLYQN